MGWMKLGALVLSLAVGLGAFGAHGLKQSLTPKAMDWWQVAVDYHFLHGFALLFVGTHLDAAPRRFSMVTSGRLFALGLILFSGSLYTLAVTGYRWLGMVTPFGGLCFIAGWVAFAHAFRSVK